MKIETPILSSRSKGKLGTLDKSLTHVHLRRRLLAAQDRAPHRNSPSSHALTADFRLSCLQDGRGERAPRAQYVRTVPEDDAGRVSGGARPRRRRPRAQRRRPLDDTRSVRRGAAGAAGRPLHALPPPAGCGSSTTRTARAAGNSAAGARSLGAALAPLAASASTPAVLAAGPLSVRLYVLRG